MTWRPGRRTQQAGTPVSGQHPTEESVASTPPKRLAVNDGLLAEHLAGVEVLIDHVVLQHQVGDPLDLGRLVG